MSRSKKRLFEEIRDSSMVKIVLECTICGVEHESDMNYTFDDADTELDEFSNQLYDDGWRIFNSKMYGQIGLTCGECIENEK